MRCPQIFESGTWTTYRLHLAGLRPTGPTVVYDSLSRTSLKRRGNVKTKSSNDKWNRGNCPQSHTQFDDFFTFFHAILVFPRSLSVYMFGHKLTALLINVAISHSQARPPPPHSVFVIGTRGKEEQIEQFYQWPQSHYRSVWVALLRLCAG